MREVTSEAELGEITGTAAARAIIKERSRLHQRDREWLAASPFCLTATSGPDGSCDVPPKGQPCPDAMVVREHRPVLALVVDIEQMERSYGPSYADGLYREVPP